MGAADHRFERSSISWLLDRLDQSFGIGIAMPSGFDAHTTLNNGCQVLSNSGVVNQVRGGLSTSSLKELLKAVGFNQTQRLTVGIWAGWGNIALPAGALLVDLPDRPTYFFTTSTARCLEGFSADPDWYLPATVLAPPLHDWVLAGDIDSSRSHFGSSRAIVDKVAANA